MIAGTNATFTVEVRQVERQRWTSGHRQRSIGLRGMPTTLFVDEQGQILEQRTGELTERTLVETLERLFGVVDKV